MLPFSRILNYGNIAPTQKWYDGSLLAYDSTIFNSSGFTDYNSHSMLLTTNSSGILPSKGTESFKYGSGIIIPGGINDSTTGNGNSSIGINNLPSTVVNSSWALDFWVKVSAITNSNGFNIFPLTHYPSVSWSTYNTRVIIGCYNNAYSFWNNSAGATATASANVNTLQSTTFQHFAMQYDSINHVIRCFLNGVLWSTTNFTINYTQTSTGFFRMMGSNSTALNGIIERYRFRTGTPFSNTGFNTNSIYPDGS